MEEARAYEYNYNDNSITPSRRTFGASESFLLEHGVLTSLVGQEEATGTQAEEANADDRNMNMLPYTPVKNGDLKLTPSGNDGIYYESTNSCTRNNGDIGNRDRDRDGAAARSGSGMGVKRTRSHCHNQDLSYREPSVTELDRIQRRRREETERHNAELQSFSILEKLRQRQNEVNASNADVHHAGSACGSSSEDDFFMNTAFLPNANANSRGSVALRTRRRCGSVNENIFDSAFVNQNPIRTNLSPSGSGTSLSSFMTTRTHSFQNEDNAACSGFDVTHRMGKKQRSAPPPPKLNIRPHKHSHSAFQDQEQPVIIGQETDCSNKLGELFPSPHSNKFVLQFPDAPQQELTLHDDIDEEDVTSSEEDIPSPKDHDQRSGNNSSGTALDLSSPTPNSNHGVEESFPVPFNTPVLPLGQRNINCDTPKTLQGQGEGRISCRGRDKAPAVPSHTSPSDASTSLSPHPVNNMNHRRRRGSIRKKKILLRPKHYQGKIFDASKTIMGIDNDDCGVSPCPSINSSSTADNTNRIAASAILKSALPPDQFEGHQSNVTMSNGSAVDAKVAFQGQANKTHTSHARQGVFKSLDEMTDELTLNDHSSLPTSVHPLPSRLPSQFHQEQEEKTNHMDLSCSSGPSIQFSEGTSNDAKAPAVASRIGVSRRGGAFLSLRPKSGRQNSLNLNSDNVSGTPTDAISSAPIPASHADEGKDMELDPNPNLSQDVKCSIHSATIAYNANAGPQSGQQYDETINSTPQHLRNPSFLPTPSPTHSGPAGGNYAHLHQRQQPPQYWTRSLSSNDISDQIEMAKEAAARFGGPGPTRFLLDDNHSVSDAFSPSNLSESNFRTPNPESSAKRKQHWFQCSIVGNDNTGVAPNPPPQNNTEWVTTGHNATNGLNGKQSDAPEKKGYMVELLLPSLFLSPSEEQSSSSPSRRLTNSNSFFGKMKVASSPSLSTSSWKKSPMSSAPSKVKEALSPPSASWQKSPMSPASS